MSVKLKVLKTWLDGDFTLIFQVQMLGHDREDLPKKAHLLLDLRQQSFGLRLSIDKPAQASANHAFIQIMRKHVPQPTLKLIERSAEGHYRVPLLAGGDGYWQILLQASKPPLASLVDPEGLVHVSYGQKGTFTKKRQLTDTEIGSEWTDVLPEIFEKFAGTQSPVDETEEADNETLEAEGETEALSEAQRELAGRLRRKLKTLKKSLERVEADLPTKDEVEAIRSEAVHLQRYHYLVTPEAIELSLDAAQTEHGRPLAIPLNPDLSVGRNIEAAFARARKFDKKLSMGTDQAQSLKRELAQLDHDILFLREAPRSESVWRDIIARYKLPELKMSSAAQPQPVARPYKTYIASTGHTILVGKGSHENDELTKSARANDYWLHATGVTGSHVIIPSNAEIRNALPDKLLREAAILALHHSRFKDDCAGECYVTRRSLLKKQKGMPAGLWKIVQSETIFIRYQAAEAQAILQRIKA